MQCPRCFGNDTTLVNNTHYICNNESCVDDLGRRTQFNIIFDEKIKFPSNEIFIGRSLNNFYRKSYIKLDE